ncbi:MAG: fibronectin type III domain-containing protein, partial [Bacteroidota bacterium]
GDPFIDQATPEEAVPSTVTICSALLQWTDINATSYNLRYRAVGTGNWINVNNITTNSHRLGQLDNITNYEWQVSGLCDTDQWPWSEVFTFQTGKACPSPFNLQVSEIGSCTSLLTWQETGALSYTVRYRACNDMNFSTLTVSSNQALIDNLSPGTCYIAEIVADCSCASSTSDPIDLRTQDCDAPNLISISARACSIDLTVESEEIDVITLLVNGLPRRFNILPGTNTISTNVNPNQTYQVSVLYECQTADCPQFTNVNLGDFLFTTPSLSSVCAPPNNLRYEERLFLGRFYLDLFWDHSPEATSYDIRYRTDPQGAFIPATSSSSSTSVLIPNVSELCYFEFEVRSRCECGSSNEISTWVNATFDETQVACQAVGNLSTLFSCEVVFLVHDLTVCGEYEHRFREVGTTDWYTFDVTSGGIGINRATFLEAGSDYEWQVRVICQDGTELSWSASDFFSIPGCDTPTQLAFEELSSSSVRLIWGQTAVGNSYRLRWREQGTSTWNTVTLTNNQYTVTGLSPEINYEWEVQSICSNNPGGCPFLESDWSMPGIFVIANPCTTELADNFLCEWSPLFLGYRISWDAVPGAVGYEIEVFYNDPDCCEHSELRITRSYTISPNSASRVRFIVPEYVGVDEQIVRFNCFSFRVRTICSDDEPLGSFTEKQCSNCIAIPDPFFPRKDHPAPVTTAPNDLLDAPIPAVATAVQIKLFPNPAREQLSLELSDAPMDAPVQLWIYDVLSRDMGLHQLLPPTLGTKRTQVLDISALDAGLYTLVVKIGEQRFSRRFVKLKGE